MQKLTKKILYLTPVMYKSNLYLTWDVLRFKEKNIQIQHPYPRYDVHRHTEMHALYVKL